MAKSKTSGKSAFAVVDTSPRVPLKIIPLGGLGEVGKNITALEYDNDIIIIDCGLGFPDDDMLGVDLVIPDVTYIEKNIEKVRGFVLTHGHEDHLGGLPYVLQDIPAPVYGTRLTLGILQNKMLEHTYEYEPQLHQVSAGDTIKLGAFSVEFIHVNHSIADACALAIRTPVGLLVHSGDFKIDLTPIDGELIDLTRFGELGREGVLMFMCESTNAERNGYTPSEKLVGRSLDGIFMANTDKRIVIATFSSNVHRVQQIINCSVEYGRKVIISGRSMSNIVAAAIDLGYMDVPEGAIIDVSDIGKYPPEKITIVTTGSQGEPMSALYRMAFTDHSQIELGAGDLVILSSHAIPGNEKLIGRITSELLKKGAVVFSDSLVEVHVSGHACREEIKTLIALLKPKYYMPVHGEYKHLIRNKELAMEMGIPTENIFVSDIGKVLEIDSTKAKWGVPVTSGRVLVDGTGIGDVGNIVLRDRRHLAQDGLIVVVATVDVDGCQLLSGPDIVSRGFVYVRESEDLMDQMRLISREAIEDCLESGIVEWTQIKARVKDELSKFLFAKTKRKPMILPVVMNV